MDWDIYDIGDSICDSIYMRSIVEKEEKKVGHYLFRHYFFMSTPYNDSGNPIPHGCRECGLSDMRILHGNIWI